MISSDDLINYTLPNKVFDKIYEEVRSLEKELEDAKRGLIKAKAEGDLSENADYDYFTSLVSVIEPHIKTNRNYISKVIVKPLEEIYKENKYIYRKIKFKLWNREDMEEKPKYQSLILTPLYNVGKDSFLPISTEFAEQLITSLEEESSFIYDKSLVTATGIEDLKEEDLLW